MPYLGITNLAATVYAVRLRLHRQSNIGRGLGGGRHGFHGYFVHKIVIFTAKTPLFYVLFLYFYVFTCGYMIP
jgi:hypothetical protein